MKTFKFYNLLSLLRISDFSRFLVSLLVATFAFHAPLRAGGWTVKHLTEKPTIDASVALDDATEVAKMNAKENPNCPQPVLPPGDNQPRNAFITNFINNDSEVIAAKENIKREKKERVSPLGIGEIIHFWVEGDFEAIGTGELSEWKIIEGEKYAELSSVSDAETSKIIAESNALSMRLGITEESPMVVGLAVRLKVNLDKEADGKTVKLEVKVVSGAKQVIEMKLKTPKYWRAKIPLSVAEFREEGRFSYPNAYEGHSVVSTKEELEEITKLSLASYSIRQVCSPSDVSFAYVFFREVDKCRPCPKLQGPSIKDGSGSIISIDKEFTEERTRHKTGDSAVPLSSGVHAMDYESWYISDYIGGSFLDRSTSRKEGGKMKRYPQPPYSEQMRQSIDQFGEHFFTWHCGFELYDGKEMKKSLGTMKDTTQIFSWGSDIAQYYAKCSKFGGTFVKRTVVTTFEPFDDADQLDGTRITVDLEHTSHSYTQD